MVPDDDGEEQTTTFISPVRPRPQHERVAGESGEVHVEVVGGPMDGERGRAAHSTVTIGRGMDNDLSLHLDPHVSTRHARIVREGDHYWLEDLGSSNGTYLGDQRIVGRTLIGPGTIFLVGQTYIEFVR